MFITFEGVDGSGKSTQAKLLSSYLISKGYRTLLTREPGNGIPEVRDILLSTQSKLSPLSEVLLFNADRAEHVSRVMKPALQNGSIVICDRYSDSTRAYQCGGNRVSKLVAERIIIEAEQGLVPTLTFLLDIDVKVGIDRVMANRTQKDKYDNQDPEFYERVSNYFKALSYQDDSRWVVIDGNRSSEVVHREVVSHVLDRLDPAVF